MKKKAAKKEESKKPSVSCASTARELIKAGKSNEEVWEVIKEKFKLDDSKRHYPSWYRSEMKRKEVQP